MRQQTSAPLPIGRMAIDPVVCGCCLWELGSVCTPGKRRAAHPPTATKSYTPTPCTIRNLHGPFASPHVMRGLRWHCAPLTRHEPIDVAWCPCLDHHRPLKANEAVANLGVVMPRQTLSRRKGQHLHTQIGTLGYQLAASDRII